MTDFINNGGIFSVVCLFQCAEIVHAGSLFE